MALNFNVDPYYDDFDPSKNFHRILFKPGSAIQARELTQSQTLLQSQISKFADNIFSQNTPVTGGKVTTNLNCYYLKLNTQYDGVDITASNFLNKVIQDSTGTILAKVIRTVETTTGSVTGDSPTLIVSYLSGVKFSDAQVVYCADGSNFNATTSGISGGTTCTGLSSVASISDGVFYIVNGYSQSSAPNSDGSFTKYSIGNFVSVQPQTAILSKYSNSPSVRVGLQITETIYDYVNDSSLLDPAIGASNYQAPGADRYVIELELITLPLALGNDDGFIELLRIENGSISKQTDDTVYSVIDDYFAKRDYETNGDYIVNDFKLTPNTESSGDSTKYNLGIGPGIAYVHGYRVENQSKVLLTGNRAQTTDSINNNDVYVDYGSYFYVDNANGVFDVTSMPIVSLHSVPASNIVSTNTTTYTSTLVGTGYIRNLSYSSFGTNSNTKSYVYKAYISDIKTNTLSSNSTGSSTTTSIAFYDTTGKFSSKANAYYGSTISITSGTSVGDIRKVVSYNGATKIATVDQAFTITPDTTSNFSIVFNTTDIESIVQVNGSYGLTANANINPNNGKVSGIDTGDTIYQSVGMPEMIFNLGYSFAATLTNTNYYSTKVYRGKTFTGNILTLDSKSGNASSPIRFQGSGTLSADAVKQNFIVIDRATGSLLDFSSSGNTVSISSSNTATFTGNTTSGVYSGKTVDIIAQVQVSSGDSTSYVLKSKNLIIGNTTAALAQSSGTTVNTNWKVLPESGQVYILNAGISNPSSSISLYVSDVKKIKKIIDTKASGTVVTNAMLIDSTYDVTNFFSFDNGQRDNFYDHSSIKLLPGAPKPQGNILIIFDGYAHTAGSSGDGYFSIRSYLGSGAGGVAISPENYAEIGSYTSTHGTSYRLTDSIDFRPVRANYSTTYIWEYTGTPTTSNDVGMLMPYNLTNFQGDYSYYLGRKDKLVLTKDKKFLIIEGTPSTNPRYPTEPDGSLVLANISLDPYTAYVPGENSPTKTSNLSINKVLHKRWAKKDITDLEDRVNNLEYYTSLSLLEQNAQALQVPDVNGLNRFKNGILVDDFASFSTADTTNPDYSSNINIRKNQLTPLSLVNNFQLQNPAVLASLGTLSNTNTYAVSSISGTQTNIFTLPYTKSNVIVQPLASSTISVNPFNVVVQEGVTQLNPPMDNWVDNNQAPAILVTDPALQVYQQSAGINYTNMGDWQTIPGTTTTTSTSSSYVNHGQFNGPYGGVVGYTQTLTNTYGSQLQNITASGYTSIPVGSAINNGFLTNISILPYIRPQQIVVKAKGLLVNTPVSTFFDGKNVGQYMTSPNTIELTNVNATNGGFKENDIVGFYLAGTGNFYPVARVISVYNYPDFGTSGSANTSRLYVAKVVNTANTYGTTTLQNATFDSNGSYLSAGNTAQGTLTSTNIITIHQSGTVSGVGGGYANVLGGSATTQYYVAPDVGNYSSFLNQYGIWGDQTNSTTYNAAFPVLFSSTDTYTLTIACSGSVTVYSNGVSIGTSSDVSPTTATVSITASANPKTISWAATSSGTTTSAFALTITNSSGTIVFDTINPVYYSTYSIPTGVSTEIIMPKGGAWFTGVTQVKLASDASSNTNFYAGSKINITSKYVYDVTVAATYVPPPPAPSGGGGGGGGGRVICTHMTEIGEMTLDDLAADLEFTKQIDENTIKGYHSWAFFVVEHMRKHPKSLVTTIAKYFAQHRTNEIKYLLGLTDKPDYIGKYVRFFGETYCWGLGTLINNSNMYNVKEKIQKQLEQAEKTLKEPSMNYIAKVYEKAFK